MEINHPVSPDVSRLSMIHLPLAAGSHVFVPSTEGVLQCHDCIQKEMGFTNPERRLPDGRRLSVWVHGTSFC